MEGWLQRRSELAAGGEAVDQEDSEPDPKRKVGPRLSTSPIGLIGTNLPWLKL